jgi:hypothetical protein
MIYKPIIAPGIPCLNFVDAQFAAVRLGLLMNDATKRSILRWIHMVFSIPIVAFLCWS